MPVSEVVPDSLRQQFTSLVVDGDAPHTTSAPGSDGLAKEDAELERRVLEALERHPGTSQSGLRAALRGTRQKNVDEAVLGLVDAKFVEDRRKGSAHAYHVTAAGRARLEARSGSHDVSETGQEFIAVSDLERTASEQPKGGA